MVLANSFSNNSTEDETGPVDNVTVDDSSSQEPSQTVTSSSFPDSSSTALEIVDAREEPSQDEISLDDFRKIVKAKYIYFDSSVVYKNLRSTTCPDQSCANKIIIKAVKVKGVAIECKLLRKN